MASNYEVMREALQSIQQVLKYDTDIAEDGTIIKDCGDYLQMIVPMDNSKGYNTYDVYMGPNGIERVLSHSSNSGPTGQIYP